MSFNVGNFGGVLYKDDLKLCTFKFHNGILDNTTIAVFCDDPFYFPLSIRDWSSTECWNRFFQQQIIPSTRHNIEQDLLTTGIITEYNVEQLLRYTEARNDANHYWVKCDNDLSCWEPWQIEELRKQGKI